MKRTGVITVVLALFILSYSPVHAGMSVHHVDGQIAPDTISYGVPITFYILWDGREYPGCDVTGSSLGYRFYSPMGTPLSITAGYWNSEVDWGAMFDGGTFTEIIPGVNDVAGDTIGFGGFRLFGPGVPDTFVNIAHIIELAPFPPSAEGGELCVQKSGYGPGPWIWSTTCGAQAPSWSGPHCYTIANCCVGIRGDANLDGSLDVADLTFLIDYLFQGGPDPLCHAEADVNASTGVAITDLTYLVDYLFRGGLAPSACPEE